MSVTTTLKIWIEAIDDGDNSEVFDGSQGRHVVDFIAAWADGTGANQADIVYSDTTTVVASATNTLDISGAINDAYGNAFIPVTVKALWIRNKNTTDGDDLNVGPAAANGWTGFFADDSDRIVIQAGGIFLVTSQDGVGVTAGTGDDLAIIEVGGVNTITYDIVIIAASA